MRKHCLALAVAILILPSTPLLAAPTLDVGLLVYRADETLSYVGWPLLFEVSFANQGAMNDWLYNQGIEAELAEIDGFVASGDLTEAEAEEMREALVLREIDPVVLGADGLPWTEFVSFQTSDGVLPWPIELLAEEVPPALVLGETGAAVAWYALSVEDSASISPGVYEISVVVSTDGIEPLPDDVWTGTTASSSTGLEILPEPELTDELRLTKEIVFGRYELYRGEFEAAEVHLLDAVELDPTSADAWTLLGEAQYARGALEDALESFVQAVELELGEEPEPCDVGEPPGYLLFWIAQIQEELGLLP